VNGHLKCLPESWFQRIERGCGPDRNFDARKPNKRPLLPRLDFANEWSTFRCPPFQCRNSDTFANFTYPKAEGKDASLEMAGNTRTKKGFKPGRSRLCLMSLDGIRWSVNILLIPAQPPLGTAVATGEPLSK